MKSTQTQSTKTGKRTMSRGETWFTSDTHFGHHNILKYTSGARGKTVEEMDERLVERWNSRVSIRDTVWHLGDVCFGDPIILWRLNGKINLIIGNHDHKHLKFDCFSRRFDRIENYIELKTPLSNTKTVLCHYPFASWNKSYYGAPHLHGHCHGQMKEIVPGRIDVGVDTHPELAPYSIEELKQKLEML